ncbi:hypothetical protein B488_04720 [Liberibacter crescens BT-1]|uniref:Uncharacterized protein n=1 Tax=Liberibacter crescens (strain BT-1) TaxID=1215343 RepID=L0ESI0_LIBCB|nr:hypothetical protein [Liberibacter crescens]AGA64464.1 hypothetical protein B488_04720 [Liberibacter crescens BT-1]AMC12636.1 hypothetical protein RL73_02480 [Liberibacter crescens]
MEDDEMLRIEFKHEKPVELIDLTISLTALAEGFREYEVSPHNDARLYIKTISEGSIVIDLIKDFVDQLPVYTPTIVGFTKLLKKIIDYFLFSKSEEGFVPNIKQAKMISKLVGPVAKDLNSELRITNILSTVNINAPVNIYINSNNANALQNMAREHLRKEPEVDGIFTDQLMTIEQVKNNAASKTGDRGIVEKISHKPVKLQFISEEVKRIILEIPKNPLKCTFIVNLEARVNGGKIVIYRILEVLDFFEEE